MNLYSKLNRIEKNLRCSDLFFKVPDFDNWTEDELNQYIVSWQNKFHIENKINNFQDAKRILESELIRDLISNDEFDLILKGEKEFWAEAAKSKSEVIFI